MKGLLYGGVVLVSEKVLRFGGVRVRGCFSVERKEGYRGGSMSVNALDMAPRYGKTAGHLSAAQGMQERLGVVNGKGKEVRAAEGLTRPPSQSIWQQPKRKEGTYAEQYLNAYKSRWMMRRDPAMSAYHARQSVLSRMQSYPTGRQTEQRTEEY